MIPIHDNVFIITQKRPVVIYGLIGVYLALFLWELKLEVAGELGIWINNFALTPGVITGAFTGAVAGNPAAGFVAFWRLSGLFFGMFLHGSFSQILGNLLFLWVFGRTLEKILGHLHFLAFYLISGLIVGLVQILAEPSLAVPLIGASGAIASVLGAYIFKFPKAKIDTVLPLLIVFIPIQLPAFSYAFWWFVQQLFYGIGSLNIPPNGVNPFSIGYWAHGVGLLIGAGFMKWRMRG